MTLAEIRQKIEVMSSIEARNKGNPNKSNIDRELSDARFERSPKDIPFQDSPLNKTNAGAPPFLTNFKPTTFITKQSYFMGSPSRPPIRHDSGFSKVPKEPPTLQDYLVYYKWVAMSESAGVLRTDLNDAVSAYNHFLNGNGKTRKFSYERYVANDQSGRITLKNALLEAQWWIIELWECNGQPKQFNFTGPEIRCGGNNKLDSMGIIRKNFPYPATENWAKAIGAHSIWISGSVKVTSDGINPKFFAKITVHAEDQYNFNANMADIATGIEDSVNGRFVVVGLANGYRNEGSLTRKLEWKGVDLGFSSFGSALPNTQKRPSSNR